MAMVTLITRLKKGNKSYRLPGESKSQCVSRKVSINDKKYKHDQAVAVSINECD